MNKFDDIPIKELNKADGYQQPPNNADNITEEDVDESKLTFIQKIEHTKWKIRQKAYKDLSDLFY